MTELPVSVRVALWTTEAWRAGSPLERALALAMPDLDDIRGDLQRLSLWGELGEQALLVALPRTGDTTSLPACSPDAAGLATRAGEAVYVAGIGGMLVPRLSRYGTEGDEGLSVQWQAVDADPVPRHRLEMLDEREAARDLARAVAQATAELEQVGGLPWSRGELADLSGPVRWGLPSALAPRAASVIESAATVGRLAHAGLRAEEATAALDAGTSGRRQQVLRTLSARADRALTTATNAAVAVLAGWRPA